MQVEHRPQLLLGPVVLADLGGQAVHPSFFALVGGTAIGFESFLHLFTDGVPSFDPVSFHQ